MSVWFITGASRGFGAEIARAALARGHQIVAGARDIGAIERLDLAPVENLLPVTLDVTDDDQVHDSVAVALERFGRIDVLVNNAGRGVLGAVEEVSDAQARAVYDINVFGLLAVTRAVTPVLRAQRGGSIVNISSIGGFVGSPGWGIYNSTKFAVEAISEAMRAELEPLGVAVMIVEPGYFRTDFLDSSSLHVEPNMISDYAVGPVGNMRERARSVNHGQPGDPAKGARAIVDAVDSGRSPLRLQLGNDTLRAVETKIGYVQKELDEWRTIAASTDHDDVVTHI